MNIIITFLYECYGIINCIKYICDEMRNTKFIIRQSEKIYKWYFLLKKHLTQKVQHDNIKY